MEVEDLEPDNFIDETELGTSSGTLHFELSNSGLRPLGRYAV